MKIKIECQGADRLSIDNLETFPGIRKKTTPDNLSKLKRTILKQGFSAPIAVWNDGQVNRILDGEQRLKSLRSLEEEGYGIPDIPVDYIEALTIKEAKLKLLTLNSQYGDYYKSGLIEFVNDLDHEELQKSIRLVDGDLITDFVSANDFDDIAPADLEIPQITTQGDIWELNQHRLICGSSLDQANVELVLEKKKPDLTFTDPPYGINIAKTGHIGGGGSTYKPILGDEDTETATQFFQLCKSLKFQNFIIWGGNYFTKFLPPSSCWLVWDKREETPSNSFSDVELAWTSFKRAARIYRQLWNGVMRRGSRKDEGVRRYHPTQKPVGIHFQILEDFSEKGQLIYDGFAGSGSLLIACEKSGRRFCGNEDEPHYCNVMVWRLKEWCDRNGHKFEAKKNGKSWEYLEENQSLENLD